MQTLAIDLGKQSFHLYGITDDGGGHFAQSKPSEAARCGD